MLAHQEKRNFHRMNLECRMKFKLVGTTEEYLGTCLNISGAGLLFSTEQAIQAGKALEVQVEPDSTIMPQIGAFVEVTRCEAINDNHFRLASNIKGIRAN